MKRKVAGCLSALAAVFVAGLLLPHVATAEDGYAEAQKDGFKAIAFFETDKNWKEKWYRFSQHTQFNITDRLKPGEEATLLVGFIDAEHDASGKINVRCDLEITNPDGSSGGSARDVPCAPPDWPKRPGVLTPTFMTVTAKADEKRQAGTSLFDIGVTDAVRGVRLDLKLTLTIEAAE